jgi:Kef-type K+ transport system membrane component KefB/nucleotide-binding universal stress UspA family protein
MKLLQSLLEGGENPVLLLLVQVALILALSRSIGLLFARFRQPQVVGEMVAGITLGPSVFGHFAPAAAALVFPAVSTGNKGYLYALSQIGVIYFLFLVGLELDMRLLRNRGRTALIISNVGIFFPFLLGVLLVYALYGTLFSQGSQGIHIPFRSVALFIGASMSVTAFPVLARILTERNLHRTPIGAISITCAAWDDVSAWCMLAIVVGISRAQGVHAGLMTAAMAVLYVLVMFLGVRPFLRRVQQIYERQQRLSQHMMGLLLLIVLASAYCTEIIGIHALFGAFLAGAMMPKGSAFVHAITEKLEDFTVIFLLPIFFAYTGLNTRLGNLDTPTLWMYCGLIILIACMGKFGGVTLTARACGLPWRESSAVGILMNTRGLMELVILNVGRELGVISDTVFAMMVMMALITTGLTTPILHLVYPQKKLEDESGAAHTGGYSVLIPVSLPASGGPLVQLANALTGSDDEERRIIALYLKRPVDRDAYRAPIDVEQPAEDLEALQPLLEEARREKIPVTPVAFTSRDVASDIARTGRLRNVDLILMGFHNPVFSSSILGGTVHRVLTGSDNDVAIFVDRGVASLQRVLVPYLGSKHDRLALEMAGRLARHTQASVTVLHVVRQGRSDGEQITHAKTATDRVFNDPTQPLPVTFRTIEGDAPVDVVIEQARDFDLIIVGVAEQWGLESQLLGFRAERIATESSASLLIVRKRGEFHAAKGIQQSDSGKTATLAQAAP